MDQQRVLNQEEQRRILEENAQREQTRIQRMEIIQEIADLERERDRTTNRLRRSCNQTLSKFNFGRMEDLYIALMDLDSRLILRINDWEELLDSDESGNPIYPDRGIPEYRYSTEAENFCRKTKSIEFTEIDDLLNTLQDSFIKQNESVNKQFEDFNKESNMLLCHEY